MGDWKRAPEDHFRELGKLHDGRRVAIRSCAELEDSQSGAVPGQFKSVLQVDSNDFDSVVEAVETVISSYLSGGRNGINDLVLIQDFVADASHSGVCVAFGAGNYIEVEYVGSDGLTNDVTAGRQGRRICISPHGSNDAPWAKLGRAALRIAEELGGPVIIEFAVEKNVICILQARRLNENPPKFSSAPSPKEFELEIADCLPLSSMSDWNPAEILGADPKPLDISFYRSLITQETWVEGRASLGWRRPSSAHDLLKTVFGKPYVRVATSLESLLPAALPSDTMRELLHDRLQYLKLNPGLHDKIEFLVAPSAPTTDHLSFIERFQLNQVKQSSALLYFDSLRQLVRNCLSEGHSWRSNDLAGIEKLRAASRRLHDVDVTHLTHRDFGRLIDGAMKVCKEKGTLPFARQARLAFMCRQILDYLLEASPDARGIVAKWMLQISSPYSQMELFLERMRHDQGSTEDFLLEFGHLRPLMYSITSTRLDSDLTLYNSIIHKEDIFHPTGICTPSTPKIDVAADYLTSIGLNWDSERILEECANAFSAREKLKFEFSRITSAILKVIANWAEAYGIELDNIRNTSLPELLKAMDTCESSKALRHMIGNIAEQHLSAPKVSDRYLPEIAFQLTDFMCVQEQASSPTFIGERAARGRVYFMDRANVNHGASLMGKIVVAEAADPGLDWIFTQGIAGLVTKFGGRFSHMALRAAQVGIAAAIGCGDELYRSAIVSDEIELRPMEEKLVFFDRPPR